MTFPNRPDESEARSNRAPLIGPVVAGQDSAATPPAVRLEPVPPLFVRHITPAVEPESAPPASSWDEDRGSASEWTTRGPSGDLDAEVVSSGDVRAGDDSSEWVIGSGGVEAGVVGGEEVEISLDAWTSSPAIDEVGQVIPSDGAGDTWAWMESTGSARGGGDHAGDPEEVGPESAPDPLSQGSSGDWEGGYEMEAPPPLTDVFGSDAGVWSPPPGYAPASEEAVTGDAASAGQGAEPSEWQPVGEGEGLSDDGSIGASPQDSVAETTEGPDALPSDAGGWDAFTLAPLESAFGAPLDSSSVWQDDASGTGYGRSANQIVEEDVVAGADNLPASEHISDNLYTPADQTDGGVEEQMPGEPSARDSLQNTWESTDDLSAVGPVTDASTGSAGDEDDVEDGSADWYASAVIVPEPVEKAPPAAAEPAFEQSDADSVVGIPAQSTYLLDPRANALAGRLDRIADALRSEGVSGALADAGKDPLAALIAGYLLGMADSTEARPRTETE